MPFGLPDGLALMASYITIELQAIFSLNEIKRYLVHVMIGYS